MTHTIQSASASLSPSAGDVATMSNHLDDYVWCFTVAKRIHGPLYESIIDRYVEELLSYARENGVPVFTAMHVLSGSHRADSTTCVEFAAAYITHRERQLALPDLPAAPVLKKPARRHRRRARYE